MGKSDILTTIYEALGRNDLEAMRVHVCHDVEIVERLEVPGAMVYRGIEDWERGYEREAETIDDFRVDLLDVEQVGRRYVADVRIHLRGKGSGAEVEERLAHVVDFDGDKVSRWRAFSELDEARKLAREEEIREIYELWDEGAHEQAIARVHAEVEWVEPAETIGSQSRLGRDEAHRGINEWVGSFESYEGEMVRVEAVGERVLVEYVQRVSAGGSSVAVESPIFHIWEFRDGLPARMAMYFERDQALNS